MEGEVTVLTPASSKSRSLRTTLPMSIVKQFKLKQGDRLSWKLQARGDEIVIVVKPIEREGGK
ncbi:MAG: AbrB/MazE/SpoVT family DNA-binding domain-containing protein [Methanomassiliicoccales archaeon]|nr:MAG: AbrB/MazE/SpoVT family DNA-binding domain-containing protein [Methanomassiliicoccales archaeon]